jgi:hypothetical protein
VHTLQHLTIIEACNFLISHIIKPHHKGWEWFIFLKNSTFIKGFIMASRCPFIKAVSMVSRFTFI